MCPLLRGLVAVILLSSLAACASSGKALDAAAQAKVSASQGVLGIKQPEIYAVIGQANNTALGGGAIAAGVGQLSADLQNERAQERVDEAMKPLHEALQGFDFDSLALSKLQGALPKAAWLHLGQVALTKDTSSDNYEKLLNTAQAPYTLFMTVDYHLSFNLRQLLVTEHLWLSPKPLPGSTLRHGPNGYTFTVPGSDPSNAVYETTVTYVTAVPDGVIPHQLPVQEAMDDAGQYWANGHGAMVRARLTDAMDELSRLSLQCLQNPGKPAEVKDEVAVGNKEGHVLENHDNARYVIQFDDGSVMSIDASLVKILRTGKQY